MEYLLWLQGRSQKRIYSGHRLERILSGIDFDYSIPSTENNPIWFAPYKVYRKVLDDPRKKMGETLKE